MITKMNRTEQLQQFLAERKGLINVSGLAKAIGKSVGYFQNVCRGYRMSNGKKQEMGISDEMWRQLTPIMKLCGWQEQDL